MECRPQEDGQAKVKRHLSKQAIALAMEGRWREAITANKEIVEVLPNDVDTYNRLGRAYMELGDYAQAKESYGKAAEVDPYNAIAKKNLRRLSYLSESVVGTENNAGKVEPELFIEEVGKAGVVNLHALGDQATRLKVGTGDKVSLKIEGVNLAVENGHREYLGQVDPKHGRRLIRLTEGGNKYTAAIVSSTEDRMTVIIREVYQDPSQAGRPSFPTKMVEGVRPYVADRLLRRGVEYEEEGAEESGYTVISDTGEVEPFTEESPEVDKSEIEEE
ncbi:MAG: tetratricopeptide repeat protein [Chloroflexi bacterium]|nr:tetratricopeptide repeat protein [Chloroflexota bacterium]